MCDVQYSYVAFGVVCHCSGIVFFFCGGGQGIEGLLLYKVHSSPNDETIAIFCSSYNRTCTMALFEGHVHIHDRTW